MEKIKAVIADIITVSRILFSLFLFVLSPSSALFAVLYFLCGVTDALDGFLARKLHTESKLGERLDSIADLFFAVVYAVKILPLLCLPAWIWIWTAIIAVTKITSIMIASKKAHRLWIEHSFENKFTGLLLFLLPLSVCVADVKLGATLVCIVATGTVIKEITNNGGNLMKIIIYGSQYGTTKKYADELGKRTDIEVKNYDDIDDINLYDTIIYFGALYAGGVMGMKKTFSKLSSAVDKNIIIATVGLADPTDKENTITIKRGMEKQLPKTLFEHVHIMHLRGGIDYSSLGFKHKTMMAMLYKKATGLPEEKKTAEVKAMIETYNKKVDFIDLNCLDEIVGLI